LNMKSISSYLIPFSGPHSTYTGLGLDVGPWLQQQLGHIQFTIPCCIVQGGPLQLPYSHYYYDSQYGVLSLTLSGWFRAAGLEWSSFLTPSRSPLSTKLWMLTHKGGKQDIRTKWMDMRVLGVEDASTACGGLQLPSEHLYHILSNHLPHILIPILYLYRHY
jgi:hypothetical protein